MIDEVSHEMPDSYERWRREADMRAKRSRERRAEAARKAERRLLPRTVTEWGQAAAIVVVLLVFFALLGAAAGVDLRR